MKIFTGNFANVKKYIEAGLIPISIARFNRYYSGLNYIKLAPPSSMIHEPEKTYTPNFKRVVLQPLNVQEVKNELKQLSNGKDIILLCYEKAGEFCHRRLVAEWITQSTGEEVKEFETHKPVKKATQTNLF